MFSKQISLNKGDRKMNKTQIGVRIRPTTRKKLEEIAQNKEMTISELVRRIVENYVELG